MNPHYGLEGDSYEFYNEPPIDRVLEYRMKGMSNCEAIRKVAREDKKASKGRSRK